MVMVQSIESAAYDGMPRSAIATGFVDYIISPEKMPEQLVSYVNQFYGRKITKPDIFVTDQTANSLKKIIILIRTQIGVDFSHYKQSTLIRRIERRMSLHQIKSLSDYVRYLQENQSEIQILYKEFLIGVTSFFRDPASFGVLKEKLVPEILKNKSHDQPVRVWVPACSTGEEAYSIAIVLKEYMDEVKNSLHVQIFATDLDQDAVETGRLGVEAVSLYAQNKDKIKIILMDMMMPVMDGEASIRAIRKINPEVKVIVFSGVAEKDKLKDVADNTNAFLPKPYNTDKLLKTIDEFINEK
jgi:two-component system CheB/CheR fusion protein